MKRIVNNNQDLFFIYVYVSEIFKLQKAESFGYKQNKSFCFVLGQDFLSENQLIALLLWSIQQ